MSWRGLVTMWRFFKPTLLRLAARGDVENLVLILVRYGHPISYEQLEAIAEMPDVAEKVVSRLTYRYRDNPEYHESALPLISTLCLLPNTVERAISAILDDSSWLKRI